MVTNNSANIGTAATGKVLQGAGVGTNCAFSTATYPSTAGTSGKVLISDGTNIVSSTPTFPNASATSGKFIRSDGTNWIASTPTLPTSAGSAGKILRSDGTNYVESTPTYPNAATSTGTLLRADGTNWVATTSTYPDTNAVNTLLYASSANVMAALATANSAVLVTSSSGVPSLSVTPAFYAYMSANQANATGDGTAVTVQYNTEVFDIGSNFNTGTYTFTCPNTGQYLFVLGMGCSSLGTGHTTQTYSVSVTTATFYSGTNMFFNETFSSNPVTQNVRFGSLLMSLNSGDTVLAKCTVSGSTKTVTVNLSNAFFAGFQVR